jgi:hypothetical protein
VTHDPAAILTLLAITLGYLLTCAIWPFGACRRCHGTGRIRGLGGYRLCRRCRSTGLRVRLGWRAYNWARRHHHTAFGPDRDRRYGTCQTR